MSRWFRHYAGMMRDDKLVRVAIRSGQTIERVVWVWGAILESASEIDDDGRFDFDAAEAGYFLRANEDDLRAIVSALGDVGRLSQDRVVKWGDRQFKSDRSAERQARYRERHRNGDADGRKQDRSDTGDGKVTSPSRHRDAPETETETDSSEAKASSPRTWPCPPGVDPLHWRDFLRNRKTKRLTNSETAFRSVLKDIADIADAEWPPGRLVEHAAAKGWGSINDPRKPKYGNPSNDRTDPTSAAVRSLLGSG